MMFGKRFRVAKLTPGTGVQHGEERCPGRGPPSRRRPSPRRWPTSAIALRKLFSSFTVWPAPLGPQWKMLAANRSSTGRAPVERVRLAAHHQGQSALVGRGGAAGDAGVEVCRPALGEQSDAGGWSSPVRRWTGRRRSGPGGRGRARRRRRAPPPDDVAVGQRQQQDVGAVGHLADRRGAGRHRPRRRSPRATS